MAKAEDIFHNRLQRWVRTLIINVGVILFFGLTGYALDIYFQTRPWIFLSLLILSFPVSLGIQIHQIKKI